MKAVQDGFRHFVVGLFKDNGDVEATASVFGQQVTIDTLIVFAIPFELRAVELWQLKRLHFAL